MATTTAVPASGPTAGRLVPWLKANLFNSVGNSIITIVLAVLLFWILKGLVQWGIIDAVWSAPNMRACQAAGTGACWAFVGEKWRFILFGRYPFELQWRPALVTLMLFAITGASFVPKLWRRETAYAWVAVLAVSTVLMYGGILGLEYVPSDLWSGLPLTLILSLLSMILGFPLAVLLALGRRSNLPVVKLFCTAAIEIMRGVPLITVLFMASLMLPLFLPPGFTVDKQLRALVAITLFLAAYQAEDVRAGLLALPKGQFEAADALGLSYWRKTKSIVLPQAITIVIPPLVGNLIGNFKNTSLVSIISLLDLMQTTQVALIDPNWRGLTSEAYLFLAAIYFVACFAMSRYSQWLERRLNKGKRR
ncbi:ABC transporter permease [Aliidongia dinghuensis]|uniref:ABC transporter permease n=1 Tax=Aliidongia dinghuensis TaxID=1867774 RepID=A0A8J2YS14_9PROT|nr:amino acid ABC transporter permease [Aliidongia dinghuensis]GGF13407.1 ABC transporter permease [Aliidongia dinghuensis]